MFRFEPKMSTKRIPLNVDHFSYGQQRSGRGEAPAFGMDNMMDETEKIKSRMREFEERCRKWREEVFAKTSLINEDMSRKSEFLDQRVPFADTRTHSPTAAAGPTAAGPTTHKTYIEDCANGNKKYRIDVQIGDYKQNELMLSSNGNTLIIKGDRELVNGSSTEKKSFNREITLPDYVDMSQLSANLIEAPSSPVATSFNNQLEIEAPIIMQKYSYRRSAFDKSNKQTNLSTSAPKSSTSLSDSRVQTKHQSHTSKSTTTTTSSSSTTNTTPGNIKSDQNRKGSVYDLNMNIEDTFGGHGSVHHAKSTSAELMPGYPVYDSDQGCVVYKFDLSDFDQSGIQLTVTVDRTLEIRATKQQVDTYGKVYHEFKREIVLEPEVDANLIKNVLHEGILTIKIAKATNSDGVGSVSNNHNLQAPNGFKEIYTDDGALTKLNADFKGYSPENVKIVLSANNVLKVSANQQEVGANSASVQKECTRQYTLPDWVQPENMKATMSRDGLLTIDFLAKK